MSNSPVTLDDYQAALLKIECGEGGAGTGIRGDNGHGHNNVMG